MEEIAEFLQFSKDYIKPDNLRQFSGICYEMKQQLFGKGKSNERKLKEVLKIMTIQNKTILGIYESILKLFDKDNKKLKK